MTLRSPCRDRRKIVDTGLRRSGIGQRHRAPSWAWIRYPQGSPDRAAWIGSNTTPPMFHRERLSSTHSGQHATSHSSLELPILGSENSNLEQPGGICAATVRCQSRLEVQVDREGCCESAAHVAATLSVKFAGHRQDTTRSSRRAASETFDCPRDSRRPPLTRTRPTVRGPARAACPGCHRGRMVSVRRLQISNAEASVQQVLQEEVPDLPAHLIENRLCTQLTMSATALFVDEAMPCYAGRGP